MMELNDEQVRAIDRLDSALCQFLNNADDEFDPRVWIPSIKRNFADLAAAYNECHRLKVMDLREYRVNPHHTGEDNGK